MCRTVYLHNTNLRVPKLTVWKVLPTGLCVRLKAHTHTHTHTHAHTHTHTRTHAHTHTHIHTHTYTYTHIHTHTHTYTHVHTHTVQCWVDFGDASECLECPDDRYLVDGRCRVEVRLPSHPTGGGRGGGCGGHWARYVFYFFYFIFLLNVKAVFEPARR